MTGMNLRDALRKWEEVGGSVERRRGTGEFVCSHPGLDRRVVLNSRRKDAPRQLTTSLKKLVAA